MVRYEFAQANEGPHDGDVDLDCSIAVENAGQHGDTKFREDVRPSPQPHLARWIGGHNL